LIQTVSAFQTGPTNTPPSAVATSTCAGLSCTVDGSGSSDVQNNVASYTWNFGDGTTVMATNPSHAFLVDGTFRITLTVTDAAGLTSVATTTVTVSG
jgi:PKD repeat protein